MYCHFYCFGSMIVLLDKTKIINTNFLQLQSRCKGSFREERKKHENFVAFTTLGCQVFRFSEIRRGSIDYILKFHTWTSSRTLESRCCISMAWRIASNKVIVYMYKGSWWQELFMQTESATNDLISRTCSDKYSNTFALGGGPLGTIHLCGHLLGLLGDCLVVCVTRKAETPI